MTEENAAESIASSDESQQGASMDGSEQSTPPVGVSWLDQDDQLRAMWHDQKSPEEISAVLGRSVAAIMTRAARLGLPRRTAPGRKRGYKHNGKAKKKATMNTTARVRIRSSVSDTDEVDKAAQAKIKERVCLMCLNKFQSMGAFNRICPSCKGSAEYVKGSSTPDFSFKVSGA